MIGPATALVLCLATLIAIAELWPYAALLIAWLLRLAARRLSARSADAERGAPARATCGELAPLRALRQYDDVRAREEFSRCISSSGISLPRQGGARKAANGGKQHGGRASPGARRLTPRSHP